jgi:hypothetical protein
MGSVGDFQAKATLGGCTHSLQKLPRKRIRRFQRTSRAVLCVAMRPRIAVKASGPFHARESIDFAATALEDLQQTLIGEPADFS